MKAKELVVGLLGESYFTMTEEEGGITTPTEPSEVDKAVDLGDVYDVPGYNSNVVESINKIYAATEVLVV